MKLSVWQQFSSNHSSYFTIVSAFEGPEQALAAYDEIRAILFEIDQWHREHPEESKMLIWSPDPTPAEREIAERYGVEWIMPIDWSDWGLYHLRDSQDPEERARGERAGELAAAEINLAVGVHDNLLFVADPDSTWMMGEPFATIIRRLGATRVLSLDWPTEESDDEEITARVKAWRIRLTCSGTDEEHTERLRELIHAYLIDPESHRNPPPWNEIETNLQHAVHGASIIDPKRAEILLASEAAYMERLDKSGRSSHRQTRVSVWSGEIIRRGRELVIELPIVRDLVFAALVAYLEVSGCREFRFGLIGEEVSLI